MQLKKNYGYFALLSNDIKDPLTALQLYRSKDLIEFWRALASVNNHLFLRCVRRCSLSVIAGANLNLLFFKICCYSGNISSRFS